MKTLLSTTALLLGLGLPTLVLAQIATENASTDEAMSATDMAGFPSTHGQFDLFASELNCHYGYAHRSPFAAEDQASCRARPAAKG